MGEPADTNAAIWKSAEAVEAWTAEAERQERSRQAHRHFLARLLPFADQDEFTFLDLGAGTGAASRVILDLYPRSTAILADYSAEMMRVGEREMQRFAGRYRYVEFDMSADGEWPAAIPAELEAVVTSMCVHHLPDDRKRSLFAEIFDHLGPEAARAEVTDDLTEDPLVEATWQRVNDREDPETAARRRNWTPLDHARWDNHVRYIIPIGPQLEFLRSAGFEGIDVYWKQLENLIYGGRRPVADS